MRFALVALALIPTLASARGGPAPNPVSEPWPFSNILSLATHYLHSGNPTGYPGPWCKAFTNMVLRQAGYHPGPSLRAIDALADGRRVLTPSPGDLAVTHRHVTIFEHWASPGYFIGLGGNQSHNVTEAMFSTSGVAWVRP